MTEDLTQQSIIDFMQDIRFNNPFPRKELRLAVPQHVVDYYGSEEAVLEAYERATAKFK